MEGKNAEQEKENVKCGCAAGSRSSGYRLEIDAAQARDAADWWPAAVVAHGATTPLNALLLQHIRAVHFRECTHARAALGCSQ